MMRSISSSGWKREEGLSHRRGMHGHTRSHLRAHAQRLLALVRDDVEDRIVVENREVHRFPGFFP